jgi:hypothetical protein
VLISLCCSVSLATAHRCLRRLGFSVFKHTKSYYVDGHERTDVLTYRNDYYLPLMEDLRKRAIATDPSPSEQKRLLSLPLSQRAVVVIAHDECVFHTKDDEPRSWHCDGMPKPLKQKSSGAGLMISAFVNEMQGGVLRVDDSDTALNDKANAAVESLEIGKGAYWTSEKMLNQLENAIRIGKQRFPYAELCFRFDWSSNHTKVPVAFLSFFFSFPLSHCR